VLLVASASCDGFLAQSASLAALRCGARVVVWNAAQISARLLSALQPTLVMVLDAECHMPMLSDDIAVPLLHAPRILAAAAAAPSLLESRESAAFSVACEVFTGGALLGARVDVPQTQFVVAALVKRLAIGAADRVCVVAPRESPLWLALTVALPLMARASVAAFAPDCADLDAAVRKLQPSVLIAVPRDLVLLAGAFAASPARRLAVALTLPATRIVRRAFAAACPRVPVAQLFGWIETTALATAQDPAHADDDDAGTPLDGTTIEIDADANNEVIVAGPHVNPNLMDESYLAEEAFNEMAATRALDMSLDTDRRASGTFGSLTARGALVPMPWWRADDRLDPDAMIDVLRVHASLSAHPLCRAARPFLTPAGAVVAAIAVDQARFTDVVGTLEQLKAHVRDCNLDFSARFSFTIVGFGLLWRDVALSTFGEPSPDDMWMSDAEQVRLRALTDGVWFDLPVLKAAASAPVAAAPLAAAPVVAASSVSPAASQRLAELEQQCASLVAALRQAPSVSAGADARVAELEAERAALVAQVGELRAARQALEASVAAAQGQVESLRDQAAADAAAAQARLSALADERALLDKSLVAARADHEAQQRAAALAEAAAAQRIDALEAELRQAQLQTDGGAAERSALATELAAAREQAVLRQRAADDAGATLAARVDELTATLAAADVRVRALEDELSVAKAELEQLRGESRQVETLQAALTAARVDHELALKAAEEQLAAVSSESQQRQIALTTAEADRAAEALRVAELSEQAAGERARHVDREAAFSAELAAANARVATLLEDMAKLQSLAQQGENEQVQSLVREVAALQAARQEADATVATLTEKLRVVPVPLMSNEQIEAATNQLASLGAQNEQLRTELAALAQRLEAAERRNAELQQELELARTDAQQARDASESNAKELAGRSDAALAEMRGELELARADAQKVAALQHELDQVREASKSGAAADSDAVAALRQELEASLTITSTRMVELQAEAKRARDELAAAREQHAAELAAAGSAHELEQLREASESSLTVASTRIVELQTEAKRLQEQHAHELAQLTAERDRLVAAAAAAPAATPATSDESLQRLQAKLVAVQTERDQLRLVLSEKKQAGDVELQQTKAQLDGVQSQLAAALASAAAERADASARLRLVERTHRGELEAAHAAAVASASHAEHSEVTELRATVQRLQSECEHLRADLARARAFGTATADDVAASTVKAQRLRQATDARRLSAVGLSSARPSAPTSPLRAQVQRTPPRPTNPRVVLELRGVGLSHAVANVEAQFTLRARGENGARVPTVERLRERLSYELEERQGGAVVPLACDNGVACDNGDVLFTFRYKPLHSGAHRMRVRVDGRDVVGSPFTIVVPAQASKLPTPSVLPSPSARVPSTPSSASASANGSPSLLNGTGASPLRHASPLSGVFKASSVDEQLAAVLTKHADLHLTATKLAPDRFRIGQHELQLRSVGSLLTVRELDGVRCDTPMTLHAWITSEQQP
jgi:chromosome segregation ATPase